MLGWGLHPSLLSQAAGYASALRVAMWQAGDMSLPLRSFPPLKIFVEYIL